MSSFYDEVEIQEAAVRTAVSHFNLHQQHGPLFLAVIHADEMSSTEPSARLMKRLADLSMIRPRSRGQAIRPTSPLHPTMVDKVSGETGWPMVAGTRKWRGDGSADVIVFVQFGNLSDRGLSAIARERDGRWMLEDLAVCLS